MVRIKECPKKPVLITLNIQIIFAAGILHADENSITVYQTNLGMVREFRSMEFDKNRSTIDYSDIPSKIIPTSVRVQPLHGEPDLQVVEQTFAYDTIGFKSLLKKYINRPVTIVSADGELIKGILLNTQSDTIILKMDSGVRMMGWNNKMSIQLDELPENLYIKPTLIWLFNKPLNGKKRFEVTYLTEGMNWKAEYIGVLNKADSALAITAWASIENGSGKTFDHSKIRLIAGDIQRVPKPELRHRAANIRTAAMLESAKTVVKEQRMFEYHAYELERPTTLKTNQVKQVALFAPTSVGCEKKYFFNAGRNPKNIEVRIHFENNESEGMGKPLPAGVFRMYKKTGTDLEFVGEDRIPHTPRNETVRITVGNAFDITGKRTLKSRTSLSKRSERHQVEIELNNGKNEDVTIIVEEAYFQRNWKIEDSNFTYHPKDANHVEFMVPVKAGSKSKLIYSVFMSW